MVKKILFITANTFFGGGERVFLQLASCLDKKEFLPVFACQTNEPLTSALKYAGVKHIPVDFNKQFSLGTLLSLIKIFKREAPDIIHAQGGRVSFYVRMAALFSGPRILKPVIVSTTAAPVEEYDVSALRKFIYSFLDKLTEGIDDHFIAVTRSIGSILAKKHRIAPENISVIYNGIELADFDPGRIDREEFRKELGISGETKLICSIGRLSNVKGYDYLLESAKLLFTENPGINLKYVIAGEGELRSSLTEKINAYNLGGKVILLGHRADTAKILAGSDFFVLSSIREGFPLSILEAMAMLKPVISTDFDGFEEVLADGDNALIVKKKDPVALKNAVLYLSSNPELASKLALKARSKVVNEFSLSNTVASHEEVYKELINLKQAAVKKILIVNVSGIGDFIESFAAIESIRRSFPEATITLLVSSKAFDYAKSAGIADNTLMFPVSRSRGFSLSGVKDAGAILCLLRALRGQRFDIAVNLYEIGSLTGSLRMNLLFKFIGPRLSVGRNTAGLGKFFDIKIQDEYSVPHNNFFYYGELAKGVGASDTAGNVLSFDKDDVLVRNILLKWGIDKTDKLVIINPGSDRLTRRWPAGNFAASADWLVEKHNAKIVVVGSFNEAALANEVISGMKHKEKAFSGAGVLDFSQLIALISKAKLALTTNSAAMHVAGILEVPFVAITVSGDPERDIPQGKPDKMVMLHQKMECNPCSYWKCPKTDYMKCMKLITPEEVIRNCEKFI